MIKHIYRLALVYQCQFTGGYARGTLEDMGGTSNNSLPLTNSLIYKVTKAREKYYNTKLLSVNDNKVNNNKIMNSVYPNPASSNMTVDYTVENTGNVEISILDQLGRELNLFSGLQNAGNYVKTFELNSILNSGAYYLKIKINNRAEISKIAVVK